MDCDRSWMHIKGIHGRQKDEYKKGVAGFIDFAFKDIIQDSNAKIRCPCLHCLNNFFEDRSTIRRHLFQHGVDPGYNPWIYHGEGNSFMDDHVNTDDLGEFFENNPFVSSDMASLVRDSTNVTFNHPPLSHDNAQQGSNHQPKMPDKFKRLMKVAEEELYQGCKTYSKLEFIVTLLNLKVSNHWSDKSFTELLSALHRAFNYDSSFPKSSFEAKKYTNDLGLNYEKIDACVNHCVLYRKQYANTTECPICHESRWQIRGNDMNDTNSCSTHVDEDPQKKSKVSRLVLRYFPLTARLQRLFMSSKTARHMRWHKNKCYNDDIIRHPRDSLTWKKLDECYPDFATDSRNVRLGLASDGFTPSTHLGTRYSIWPVFLVPYNLPPWMCMKSQYMMLSLLIPGPRSPGNDIDVFLEPLIDELMELWEVGAQTYDSYGKEMFHMRASLLWTINDFPAYGYLSGWSTCGKLACPSCHKGTCSVRLKHGFKQCFPGNRRFLEPDHRWRLDTKSFYGKTERGQPPSPLTGDDVLKALHGIPNIVFGKKEDLKRKLRLHQPRKLQVLIPKELGAVVGDKAKQFVAECSDWVKMFCRLDVVAWREMPEDVEDRLYTTIKEKYDLPAEAYIDRAIEVQCMNLFRHWRERLKAKHFKGKSLNTAITHPPPNVHPDQWTWLCRHWNSDKQKKKSETNKLNAKSNKIKSACGAKSSARILHELGVQNSVENSVLCDANAENEGNAEMETSNGASATTSTASAEPIYIKAWNKLKRHADGKLDDEAELKLLQFQELHEREIREKGVDNLSIQEAFLEVLGYRSGYARGLGKGAPVMSKGKKTLSTLESDLQQLRSRENELLEIVKRMEVEAIEAREKEKRREEEMKIREERLREELNAEMQKKMDEFMSTLQARLG